MFKVSGVHHVAIGVKDLKTTLAFYRELMGFTETFAEFAESEQEIMREVARNPRAVFFGATIQQKAGGIMLELIRMVEPAPRPIRSLPAYGDIGVGKITLTAADVPGLWRDLKDSVPFLSEPKTATIAGRAREFVYCRDPEGNLIEIVSGDCVPGERFGGCWSAGMAVSNLERSLPFYRDFLGFTVTAIDVHEDFSGLVDEAAGAPGTRVRSCLLSTEGGGGTSLELFETLQPRGRSLPFSALWGDFGYLQASFACADVYRAAAELEAAGVDLLCSPKVLDAGPDHPDPGVFVYARDPDGICIEFLFVPEMGDKR